ncbi:MAG: ABC transporter ATP-binding protein [Bacteroidetes bacterium]|nr:ABC transporter ATP-binding protein [Bacteroidota bacterium]
MITRHLTKSYGPVEALRGLDLDVQRGEIFGFLGPNGAGKTTTIRCLLDLIRPDGGTATVLGLDPQTHPVAVRARVGYLPGELHLEGNHTGRRVLRYFSALRGRPVAWDVANALAERLRLDLDRPVKNLSKGNKQKVGLVQALMHRPELLLLDEPTSGLDPLMQQEVLALLREAKAGGATVFFCSHIMSEVEALAERVGIIRQGRLVEVADTAALIGRAVHHAKVQFRNPVDGDVLDGVPGVTVLARDDSRIFTLQVEGEMDGLIKALAAFPVTHLETTRASLEDVFLAYYQDDDVPTEDH